MNDIYANNYDPSVFWARRISKNTVPGKVDFDDLSVALTLLQRCGWRLAEAEVRPSSLPPSPIWNVNDYSKLVRARTTYALMPIERALSEHG